MTNQSTPTINHFVALIKLKLFDDSVSFAEGTAEKIIKELNLNVINKTSHLFQPSGITLAYILSQSHLVIHTWPEFNTLHIDLVTCSYLRMTEFENSLNSAINNDNIESIRFRRVDFSDLD